MPRFFIKEDSVSEDSITVCGADAHHISRSLRMKQGEAPTLCDGSGNEYDCTIASVSDTEVVCTVKHEKKSSSEPPYFATVYQGLAKGDRFETVIQKSVECGACEIVPLMTKRCTVKLERSDYAKKCARWNKIAEEAAKQCGRGIVPRVLEPVTFTEMLERLKSTDLSLFCYENGTYPIKEALSEADGTPKTVALVVGPEGGFDESEANAANAAGVKSITLGSRILRTESAAPFVLACLSYVFEQ